MATSWRQDRLGIVLLALGSSPLYASEAEPAGLWPWLSLLLLALLLALVFFCFWLQKDINRLHRRLHEEVLHGQDLQKRLDTVQSEDRFRTTFFHNNFHELRTPLNGIMGFLQLALQGHYGAMTPALRKQLSTCITLAGSLKQQITTILDLAESRRGQLQLRNTRISLAQLLPALEHLAESLRLKYPDSQFELKALWPADDGSFIHDQERLFIILRNLISNAFKFGKPQQRNHIVLAISKRKGALLIEISDQGMGLSPEQISRIFDDKIPLTDTAGLGLTMVRSLLRTMQGEMKVSSDVGSGSRFTLVIPEQSSVHLDAVELPPEHQDPVSKPSPEADAPAASLSLQAPSHNLMKMDGYSAHILVVDDNEINCEIIREILIPHGYRISLAFGGREALTRMRADRPDLVLLDLAMPEFSGEHVMQEKQLDSSLAEIPVIVITARASEQDRIQGLDLGADDYLTKPIIQQELVLRVRNILGRQRLTKRIALMEEREKLAQLGELITDLSREIKAIFADRLSPEAGEALCQNAIEALPQLSALGPRFSRLFLHESSSGDEVDLESLPLPKIDSDSLIHLRALRLHLAPAALDAAEKTRIWQALQQLDSGQLKLLHRVCGLAATHMNLMEQSHKSRQLMDGILEFQQKRGHQRLCRADQTLRKTIALLGPRLRLIGVRLSMDVPNQAVMIHPADLMQVSISLITTLCHRLEMLLDQDKWLHIKASTHQDHMHLRFSCGGPRLTEAQALRLFDPAAESPEASTGSGLYVARRIVQRAPGRLDFNLAEAHSCFDLELPNALAGLY